MLPIETPVVVDGTVCRVAKSGDKAVVEVWGAKGWEPGTFSLAEVLKAPPASPETLSALGFHNSAGKPRTS